MTLIKNSEEIENILNTERQKTSFLKYQGENADSDKPVLKKIMTTHVKYN